MIRLVAAALVGGLGFGAWRNAPQVAHAQPVAWGAAVVAACVLCFLAGRWRRPAASATAVAVATASSEATATAQQVLVVNVGQGAADVARARYGGLDAAPWIVGAKAPLDALDADQLEAAGADELMPDYADGVAPPPQAP